MNEKLKVIRNKNMRMLIARFGTARQLHEEGLKGYWPYDKVNRMAGRQAISNREARYIEDSLDLPSEWMDVPHMDLNLSMPEYNLLLAVRSLGKGGTELLRSVIEGFKNQLTMMQSHLNINDAP